MMSEPLNPPMGRLDAFDVGPKKLMSAEYHPDLDRRSRRHPKPPDMLAPENCDVPVHSLPWR